MQKPLYNDTDFRRVFISWWLRLSGQPQEENGEERAPERGPRAELRRAESASEVCMTEAFGMFLRTLKRNDVCPSPDDIEPLARLVGLASHVKKMEQNRSMGAIMGGPRSDGGRAAVAPARFRKFMTIEEPDDLYIALMRVLRMTDGRANLSSLARACFRWNDETRRWWALEYYNALPSNESEYKSER